MSLRLTDRDGLLARTADPYVRFFVPDDALGLTGDEGWAVLHRWRPTGHWGGFADLPEPLAAEALATLVAAGERRGVEPEWYAARADVSLEPGPPGWRLGERVGRWAAYWTERAPEAPAAAFEELDDARDAAEIEAFARPENPDFEGFPGRGLTDTWLGLREGDALVAVGAIQALATGAPYLAGIVVAGRLRGRGIGRALTAELARRAVAARGVATLTVMSDNAPAIGLYRSLGFQRVHDFASRGLTRAG